VDEDCKVLVFTYAGQPTIGCNLNVLYLPLIPLTDI
jgi:hypothetical protein